MELNLAQLHAVVGETHLHKNVSHLNMFVSRPIDKDASQCSELLSYAVTQYLQILKDKHFQIRCMFSQQGFLCLRSWVLSQTRC